MYKPQWVVCHRTGGTPTLDALYNYFQSSCVSSHYGVGYDGRIEQYVREWDGAGANCCLEPGHAPFLPTNINLNVRTISIEGLGNTNNDNDMPQAQQDAYWWLVADICKRNGIVTNVRTVYNRSTDGSQVTTFGGPNGGVIFHYDIAAVNRRRCPGLSGFNYESLWQYLQGNTSGGGNVFQPINPNDWIIRSWNRFFDALNSTGGVQTVIPRRDTGIFNQWKDLLVNKNVILGGVSTEEIYWGNDWIVQYFEAGQIWFNRTTGAYQIMTGAGPR